MLFSINVNSILHRNQHASEIIISAYLQIPPKKMERAFVTQVFCELVVFVLVYLLFHVPWFR